MDLAFEDELPRQKRTGHCHACRVLHLAATAILLTLGERTEQEGIILSLGYSSLGAVRKQPKKHRLHNAHLPFCTSGERDLLSLCSMKWRGGRGGLCPKRTHYFFYHGFQTGSVNGARTESPRLNKCQV